MDELIWAISPEHIGSVTAILNARRNPERFSAAAPIKRDAPRSAGDVGFLAISGVILQRPSMLDKLFGAVGTEELGIELDGLIGNPKVSSIIALVDSPGGGVSGVPELAQKIRKARTVKPITALVSPMAASAAFWLASQASTIATIPSGSAGSIGVMSVHEDISQALEKIGVKVTMVTSSPFKSEQFPEVPLTAEAKANMQNRVDQFHQMFVNDIALGRGVPTSVVEKSFGRGRMLSARDALAVGMVDKIATLEQLLAVPTERNARMAQARAREREIAAELDRPRRVGLAKAEAQLRILELEAAN